MVCKIVDYILVVSTLSYVCVTASGDQSSEGDDNTSSSSIVVSYAGFKETPSSILEMEASEALGARVLDRLGADRDNSFPDCCFKQCDEANNCDLVIIWTETSQCVLMSCRPAEVCMFSDEGALGFRMFLKEESEVAEVDEASTLDPISFPEAKGDENGIDFEKDSTEVEVPACDQPKHTGPCRAAFPRFYFNKKSGKCEPFIYGGCKPNENNFKTKEECVAKCSGRTDKDESKSDNAVTVEKKKGDVSICEQPKVVGMCKAAFPRFYFDQNSKACEKFIYGGCRGNENNFKSKEDCVSTCVVPDLNVEYGMDSSESSESSNETEQQSVDPFHNAHRQYFKHEDERGLQMMSPAYQLEAVVPLVIGALISMAMMMLVIYRCHVNRQIGPKRLHKIVYEGPPPTIGEVHSEDEVVNGMYT